MRILLASLSMAGILAAQTGLCEERFGVPVYPGATYDAAISDFEVKNLHVEAACFRTKDPLAKVADFYKGQKQVKSVSLPDQQNAMVRFNNGADVTLQSPSMNMSTGTMMQDTLISIVKGGFH